MIKSILLQVSIMQSEPSNGQISGRITNTLANNGIDTLYALIMFLMFVLGITKALKIYNKWQSGDSDNIEMDIAKWVGGLILVTALLYVLYFVSEGRLNGYSI